MATHRWIYGVTVDQIDELHRLVGTITAHGDMVAVCADAPLANHSVRTLGEAIFDAGRAVCGILDQVDTQRLGETGTRTAALR